MDPQKLVILGVPVRTAGCACFDLSRPTGNCQICDKGILCFPGSVRDHCTIPGMLSHLHRIQSFRESSDLVYFNKDSIGNIKFDATVQPFDIGDKQIVAYQLDLFFPGVPSDISSLPSHPPRDRLQWKQWEIFPPVFHNTLSSHRHPVDLFSFHATLPRKSTRPFLIIKLAGGCINGNGDLFSWFISCFFYGMNDQGKHFLRI